MWKSLKRDGVTPIKYTDSMTINVWYTFAVHYGYAPYALIEYWALIYTKEDTYTIALTQAIRKLYNPNMIYPLYYAYKKASPHIYQFMSDVGILPDI
jgi:hypothetical protein